MKAIYVLDTSYLLEWYAVPEFSDPVKSKEVRRRMQGALAKGQLLVLPLGCLLETGNHIADVKNAVQRDRCAASLSSHVQESGDPKSRPPYVLHPIPDRDQLPAIVRAWSTGHVTQRIGLVDATTIEVARALKLKYTAQRSVHIWTLDRALKRQEPDPENEPFVG